MRLGLALTLAAALAAEVFVPGRRLEGQPPGLPSPMTIGWIEEAVDLAVTAAGSVQSFTLLRGTRLQDSLLAPVAKTWRFRPAIDGDERVATHVLLALYVRAPQTFDGPTQATPPTELATPSEELPYLAALPRPRYPIRSLGDGMVVVEVLVGVDGRVSRAEVVQGAGGFTDEALQAARTAGFRPAVRHGKPVEAYAYLAFGFRQPVQPTPARGRP